MSSRSRSVFPLPQRSAYDPARTKGGTVMDILFAIIAIVLLAVAAALYSRTSVRAVQCAYVAAASFVAFFAWDRLSTLG